MNVFYCPSIVPPYASLDREESEHCIRVLRLGKGTRVQLIDGRGGLFEAVITVADVRQCRLEIIRSLPCPLRNFSLHIAIAPTKQMDRFEWFVEKSVEIGIDVITPLLCDRSERRVLRTDRLQKLVISAMKQAIIPNRPILNELIDFREFINNNQFQYNLLIAHCMDNSRKKPDEVCTKGSDVTILIGPEGDFTGDEIALAKAKGFIPVSLGNNRLRTETAGIVACHSVNFLNGY